MLLSVSGTRGTSVKTTPHPHPILLYKPPPILITRQCYFDLFLLEDFVMSQSGPKMTIWANWRSYSKTTVQASLSHQEASISSYFIWHLNKLVNVKKLYSRLQYVIGMTYCMLYCRIRYSCSVLSPLTGSLSLTDIAVVEMTDAFRQPSLFYHLGVRESFSMANNIILYCDTNSDSLQSLQVSCVVHTRSRTHSGMHTCLT